MRDSITVNIRPEQRQHLGALAHVRHETMYDIALQACYDYIKTPVIKSGDGILRDRLATFRFSMRIPPDLQEALEDRAALEIGAPRTPPGAPGRKTYKATIIRRAITAELEKITDDESVRIDMFLESSAA